MHARTAKPRGESAFACEHKIGAQPSLAGAGVGFLGPLVVAKIPVKDAICRIYRDDEITGWLQYDGRDRLVRQQLDMNAYKSLPIPFTATAIHWAR